MKPISIFNEQLLELLLQVNPINPKLCSRRRGTSRTICISWVYPDLENHPFVKCNETNRVDFINRFAIENFNCIIWVN